MQPLFNQQVVDILFGQKFFFFFERCNAPLQNWRQVFCASFFAKRGRIPNRHGSLSNLYGGASRESTYGFIFWDYAAILWTRALINERRLHVEAVDEKKKKIFSDAFAPLSWLECAHYILQNHPHDQCFASKRPSQINERRRKWRRACRHFKTH